MTTSPTSFILSGAEDLVPVLDDQGQRTLASRTLHGTAYRVRPYRPRVDGLFARIERWEDVASGISWAVPRVIWR